ncbi:metal ABC transporter permease [Trueperella bialowiezensis]|uniref:Manganese transport system membrane protein mntB n=1 Tax=Trueperella bialowiezensis TaxID=312285 RepID=A0A3S5EW61_9ACTO|nr:metal ABC transporter permease [Trueperella bialowiezensis]VEI13981.1 Manganese transport system membrane protein mntB [Trueperella bialowiezensis]
MVTFVGSILIGATAGALGTFAYLRKQSLISDVIAHSSFPGVLGSFLLFTALGLPSRSLLGLMLGALATGVLAVWLVNFIVAHSKVNRDAAMAVVLSTLFGAGYMILHYIQKNPIPNKGGIDSVLFGNVSTLTLGDVRLSAAIAVIVLIVVTVFFRILATYSFDQDFATVLGLRGNKVDALLFSLIALATVVGIKAVGLVLMVALVVTPPAIARQWTRRVHTMFILSGVVGAIGCAVGSYLSIKYGPLPTGPVIVVVLFIGVVFSVLVSPRRRTAMAEV